jgi:hypothetical protein
MDAKVRTIGSMIDDINKLRERKRKLTAEVDEIEKEYKTLEEEIKGRLMAEGMDKASGKTATVSISKNIVANVVDWEKVCAYVKRTGNFQLFQRRISDPAFRELLEKKKSAIPGMESFEKLSLNLRSTL